MALIQDKKPQPGDLIEISRIGYEHWAVYVGEGNVIHVAAAADVRGTSANILSSSPNKKAIVKKEKLEDVAGKNKWKINNKLDKKYTPHKRDAIVREANARIGQEINYSILKGNCEHFANDLRYGEPESRQASHCAMCTEGLMALIIIGCAAVLPLILGR